MSSFTSMKTELEKIIVQIQQQDLPFEEIQKLYTKGIKLIGSLEAELEKITVINYISKDKK
ncbi:Exodeoxyribonuclease VII small subunit [Brevinema andersonii]|uniref:Exodeoxyribonuclease VII small subunit n=1 Tax=Brevinema andersonii TaxID=34097 RepID=A0A1I1F8P6_BREAD|nr:exodeoxyribonuclease VII small subunit [Brevinema andersonii]SFB95326.1 Exodeoxyribonuclease VII small subunit [Brevinema andersonii]